MADTETDSGGQPTEIEFGGLPAANQARTDFEEHLCSQDDGRLKTVTFAPGTPEGVIDQAEAAATSSRAEADTPALEAAELTEAEKRGLDFTRDGVNVAKARYLKGLGQEYDVDAFQHVDPAEIDAVTDARPTLERAQQSGGTGRGGGAQYDDEGSERRERERQQKAEKHAKAGCDHARDECEHGDPAACEYLTEACGYDEGEVGGLLGERVEEETEQQELVTVGGDGEHPEMEVTPAAAGALRQSWQGYKSGIGEVADALDTIREEVANARRAMSTINAIRSDGGQDELHPDRLHELLAALEAMPADIPEVRTLAHYGVFDSDDGPAVEKFGTDHEVAVERFQQRLEAEGWNAEEAAERALQMAEERQRDDPRSLRERSDGDFIDAGVNRDLNQIGTRESVAASRRLDQRLNEEDAETVRDDLAEQQAGETAAERQARQERNAERRNAARAKEGLTGTPQFAGREASPETRAEAKRRVEEGRAARAAPGKFDTDHAGAADRLLDRQGTTDHRAELMRALRDYNPGEWPGVTEWYVHPGSKHALFRLGGSETLSVTFDSVSSRWKANHKDGNDHQRSGMDTAAEAVRWAKEAAERLAEGLPAFPDPDQPLGTRPSDAAPGKFDTDHAGAADRFEQRQTTDAGDSPEQFANEQQGTLGVGVESEQAAEEKQVTLTGGDADDPNEQALPAGWTRNGSNWDAGPFRVQLDSHDGSRWSVRLFGPNDSEELATGLPDATTAEEVAEGFIERVDPADVSLHSADRAVPEAAAAAKKEPLDGQDGGLSAFQSGGTRKVNLHDGDGGVTLNVPEQADGWHYDGDAPPSRGALVWVDPDETDHYVALQKTGSAQWLASHVTPDGDRTNESARYATDALDYAKELMDRFEAGGSGNPNRRPSQ